MRRIIAILLFFCCQNLLLFSQSFRITQLTQQEGLSFNQVSDLLQDKYGFLWVATHHGLNKYDGQRMQRFRAILQDSTGLSANSIAGITEDLEGNIWVNYEIGRLSRYNRKTSKFELFTYNKDDLNDSGNFVTKVLPIDLDNVLCLTAKGICKIDFERKLIVPLRLKNHPNFYIKSMGKLPSGQIWLFNGKQVLFSQDVDYELNTVLIEETKKHEIEASHFYYDKQERLWAFNEQHIYTLQPESGEFQKLNLPEGISIRNLTEDDEQNMYLATAKNGLMKITPDLAIVPSIADFPELKFLHYAIGNGVLPWLFLKNAKDEYFVYHLKKQSLEKLNIPKGIDFRDVHIGKEGVFWLGSFGAGIFQIEEKRTAFKISKIPKNKPYLVSIADWQQEGLLVAAAGNVLVMNKNGDFKKWKTPSKEVNDFIETGIFHIQNCGNAVFTFTNEKQVMVVNTATWTTNFYTPNDSQNKCCRLRKTYFDTSENVWMVTSKGLSLQLANQDSIFHFYVNDQEKNALPAEQIRTIYEDKNGVMWLGILRVGLVKATLKIENNEPKITFEKFPYLGYANSINHITDDENGGIWIGTYTSGLLHFDPKTNTYLQENDPELAGLRNIQGLILVDKQLWISSIDGLHLYDTETEQMQHFDGKDGLDNYDFWIGTAVKTKEGDLFFGRKDGVVQVLDKFGQQPADPYHLVLSNFYLFGKKKDFTQPTESLDAIHLKYNENYLGFEIVKPHFGTGKLPEYAYQLEGLDNFWTNTTGESPIFYANVPPGNYDLKVKTLNTNRTGTQSIGHWKIVIEKPFWQKTWFIILVVLTSLGLIYLVNWLLVKFKLKQEVIRNQIRQKAAADFHDEMGNKLARIALFTQVLEAKLQNPTAPIQEYLQKIQENSQSLNSSMRDFLWALDPSKDSLLDLALLLKDFGDEIFDQTAIDFTVDGLSETFQDIRLNMDWKRHLVMIFKEGMTNILKHSKATTTVLQFQLTNGLLTLTLVDNGHGFLEKNTDGLGIRNMKNRAKEIGAVLQILNQKKEGVQLKITVNLP